MPDYLFSESMPGLMGLERGDIQISMETWVDNVYEWWTGAQEKETVVNLGKIFPDAPQGWYVPTYMIKGDESRGIKPVAPDLKTVQDLKKYWELFRDREDPTKGRLYNGPSGWKVSSHNVDKITAYGLEEVFNAFDPGSQTALATAIVAAYQKGEPIVAYYWEPTPIMGKFDMTMLEEPPYDKDTFEKNRGCAYPAAQVLKCLNAEFAASNPAVVEFIKRYHTSLAQTNEGLAYMQDEGKTSEEAAIWFLKTHPDLWKTWIADSQRIDKVEKALAKAK
jgi:glycine betaine/proline transport system substrate-binding protein